MEKYGEIPPRFTKKWWGYFWEYYKWYVIGTVFVLFMIVMLVFQCTHRPQYDMTIVYTGHMTYSEAEQEKISELAAEYVGDADGNGRSSVYFQPLVFSDKGGNEEYDYAIQTKLDLTFVDEDAYIYLMDDIEAILYMQRDTITDMFEHADLYAADTDAEVLTGVDNGIGYAVSLKDSKLLKENNIDCDNLYLMVRVLSRDDDKNIKSHEGALNLAKALVE